MTTLPVTSLDEAFLNLGTQALMSVQFEVRVAGSLDPERLRAALREAVSRHPLARARLARAHLTDTRHRWEVADVPDHLSLEVTDGPADVVRERLQSRLPDVSASPAFFVALVQHPQGDHLMFNLHHAAFDGMGAVRLMTSIARAYAGVADQIGGPSIEEARDLRRIAGSRNVSDLLPRARKLAADIRDRRRVTRLAPDGGDATTAGYHLTGLRLDTEDTRRVLAHKPEGATLNDVALAAHVLTVLRWNEEHDARVGDSVSIMMPVNLRPSAWSGEVISNFASYLDIVVPASLPRDLTAAAAVVRDRTRPVKENGAAGWIVDILDRGNAMPLVVKRTMGSLLPLVQHQFVGTTNLSNVGRLTMPDFGDAGAVTEVWFSPPCMSAVMPIGLGLAGLDGELFASFRSDRRSIGRDGLERYAAMFRETITGA